MLQQQRVMLWKIFDRVVDKRKTKDNRMTEETFNEFYEMVPDELKEKLDALGGFKGGVLSVAILLFFYFAM